MFLRFDVHVAGPLVEGFQQQFVDQLDDRRGLGHLGQVVVVGRQFADEFPFFRRALRDQFVERVAADAEMVLDHLDDVDPAGEHRFEMEAADGASSSSRASRLNGSLVATTTLPFCR